MTNINTDFQSHDHAQAPAPLLNRQAGGEDTKTTTDSGNIVTTSNSLGTTGDRKGYSWRKVSSIAGLVKRQDTKTVVDEGNVVTVSKSQGTTHDRIGYSWRSVGL